MSKYYLSYIFIIISSLSVFAQSENSISKERYNFLYDSLTTEKESLLLEKENITADIDSLTNLLAEMEERCKSARSEQLIRKYGREVGKRIVSGQVWKGMTQKMLEDSWGKPDKITKNKEKWGTFTQLYYGDITYFFQDGKMIDWEE
jgi:hypothetical protein